MKRVETLALSSRAQQGVSSGKPVGGIFSHSTGTRTLPPPVTTGQTVKEGAGVTAAAAGAGRRARLGCRSVEGGSRVDCPPLSPASADPDSFQLGSGNEATSHSEEARGCHCRGCHETDRETAAGAARACGNCPALRGADYHHLCAAARSLCRPYLPAASRVE